MSVAALAPTIAIAPEARSGLDPWTRAELPAPRCLGGSVGLTVVGPGVTLISFVIVFGGGFTAFTLGIIRTGACHAHLAGYCSYWC